MFGILNLNKPQGLSSRQSLNLISKILGRKSKIGHAGTLDPLATGVLLACIGPATRLVPYVQALPKTYLGTFRLGGESDTEDSEGTVTELVNSPVLVRSDLEAVLPQFIGAIEQRPPQFSALRVNGKRAYNLARKGAEFELKPRNILIHSIAIEAFEFPNFSISVRCGSGTYIRSLGRDLGRAMGSGAYMTALQRTAVGNFNVLSSVAPDFENKEAIASALENPILCLDDYGRHPVNDDQIDWLRNGGMLEVDSEPDKILFVKEPDKLVAIAERKEGTWFRPALNFAHYWQQARQNADRS